MAKNQRLSEDKRMKTHWTEDFIDRIERTEKMYQIAYEALLHVDGIG